MTSRTALRQHDFDLGYRTVLIWLEQSEPLKAHGLDRAANTTTLQAARDHYTPPPDDGLGTTKLSSLSPGEKLSSKASCSERSRGVRSVDGCSRRRQSRLRSIEPSTAPAGASRPGLAVSGTSRVPVGMAGEASAARPCTGSSAGHGQPPNPVRR